MEFLHDIVPKKIKFKDYVAMMRKEKVHDDSDIL